MRSKGGDTEWSRGRCERVLYQVSLIESVAASKDRGATQEVKEAWGLASEPGRTQPTLVNIQGTLDTSKRPLINIIKPQNDPFPLAKTLGESTQSPSGPGFVESTLMGRCGRFHSAQKTWPSPKRKQMQLGTDALQVRDRRITRYTWLRSSLCHSTKYLV